MVTEQAHALVWRAGRHQREAPLASVRSEHTWSRAVEEECISSLVSCYVTRQNKQKYCKLVSLSLCWGNYLCWGNTFSVLPDQPISYCFFLHFLLLSLLFRLPSTFNMEKWSLSIAGHLQLAIDRPAELQCSVSQNSHLWELEQQFSTEWFEPNTWTVIGSYGYDAAHDYNVEVFFFVEKHQKTFNSWKRPVLGWDLHRSCL